VLWNRASGEPVHNAIVWQDRRTADRCAELPAELIRERTGLVPDPYFSATKLEWMLREHPAKGLAFGTVDSWLVWKLTGGRVHATDETNASRTLLCSLETLDWDDELLALFGVPREILPEIRPSGTHFGECELLGRTLPIAGIAGDQQAATIGQGCFAPGMMKSTYGTGCFALLNTGPERLVSRNRLLTTIAYQLDGKRTYALEGAIFIAGAAVQWLRDGLNLIASSSDVGPLAQRADAAEQVYLVPAFVGLGAPYWDAQARGAIFGLTRKSGAAELACAALEAVAYQTRDLLEAMHADWPASKSSTTVLRVDGGMTASDVTMQFLADILEGPVDRPMVMETTALGAAYLAGRAAGICPDLDGFAAQWRLERRFEPHMDRETRERKYSGWREAVRRTLTNPG